MTKYITRQTAYRLDGIDLIRFTMDANNIISTHNKAHSEHQIPKNLWIDSEFIAWLHFACTLRVYAEIIASKAAVRDIAIAVNRAKLIVHAAHTIIHDELAGLCADLNDTDVSKHLSNAIGDDGENRIPSATDTTLSLVKDQLTTSVFSTIGKYSSVIKSLYPAVNPVMQGYTTINKIAHLFHPQLKHPLQYEAFLLHIKYAFDAAFNMPFNKLTVIKRTTAIRLTAASSNGRPVIKDSRKLSQYPPHMYSWMEPLRDLLDTPADARATATADFHKFTPQYGSTSISLKRRTDINVRNIYVQLPGGDRHFYFLHGTSVFIIDILPALQ